MSDNKLNESEYWYPGTDLIHDWDLIMKYMGRVNIKTVKNGDGTYSVTTTIYQPLVGGDEPVATRVTTYKLGDTNIQEGEQTIDLPEDDPNHLDDSKKIRISGSPDGLIETNEPVLKNNLYYCVPESEKSLYMSDVPDSGYVGPYTVGEYVPEGFGKYHIHDRLFSNLQMLEGVHLTSGTITDVIYDYEDDLGNFDYFCFNCKSLKWVIIDPDIYPICPTPGSDYPQLTWPINSKNPYKYEGELPISYMLRGVCAFAKCDNLETVETIYLYNIFDFYCMFSECPKLKNVKIKLMGDAEEHFYSPVYYNQIKTPANSLLNYNFSGDGVKVYNYGYEVLGLSDGQFTLI